MIHKAFQALLFPLTRVALAKQFVIIKVACICNVKLRYPDTKVKCRSF